MDFAAQIRAALAAVDIRSATGFSWFGKRIAEPSARVRRELTPSSTRAWLHFTIQSQLYREFYCKGKASPGTTVPAGPRRPASGTLTSALSKANSGTGFWSSDWAFERRRDEGVEASKDGLRLFIPKTGFRTDGPGGLEPGAKIQVRFPKELPGASPGFYMALGNHELEGAQRDGLVRIYWHLSPAGVPLFVECATNRLNGAGIAFRLKTVNDPAQLSRYDAAVLYLARSNTREVWPELAELSLQMSGELAAGVPAMTRALAPGVALAEDPGNGESFGMHRCGLLAEALIRSHEADTHHVDGRVSAFRQLMYERKLDPDKPYLSHGDEDLYEPLPSRARLVNRSKVTRPTGGQDTWIDMAHRIGHCLVDDGIWSGGRCNWVGASHTLDGQASGVVVHSSLGADLYAGASGVALFLSELYRITRDTKLKTAAVGGLQQAVAQAVTVPPQTRVGLFTGWTGLAYALVRAGGLLGEERLIAEARRMIRELAHTRTEQDEEPDLLAGKAGGIAGLLAVGGAGESLDFSEFAVELGEELLTAAERSPAGSSWPARHERTGRNLTGFSHGAAGIGFALLELSAAIGDKRFLNGALEAFRYEQTQFDAKAGNWPDFRLKKGARKTSPTRTFATTWCHGAPGIGLSRVRAWQTTRREEFRTAAESAWATTDGMIRANLDSGAGNFCLCHGLAGNAELLRYGNGLLARNGAGADSLLADLARTGVERYGSEPRRFPGGGVGYTPALMTGLAGIGYFYLTMADPHTPSILALTRPDSQSLPEFG